MAIDPNDIRDLQVEESATSESTISGEIPVEIIAPYRKLALEHLAQHTTLPGFRKGHIPEKVLIDRIGEPAVLFEAAEIALKELYPAILMSKNIPAIGRPDITLTKLAPGNPVGFKITTALMPTVTLPDYRTIAKAVMETEESVAVSEEEVATFIEGLLKQRAAAEKDPNAPESAETPPTPVELTDAYVQSLGDFTDVADFKLKLRQNMERDKSARAREKKRLEVSEQIIETATIPLPRLLIESELDKMIGQHKEEIGRMNITFDDYLKRIQKTEADIRKEWEPSAAKRAKLQLILNQLAKEEKITPNPLMVEQEVNHILEHVKDADPERLRLYVESMLTNEEVFKFLEAQSEKPTKEEEQPA